MITRSRLDSVHNRRMIGRDIKDEAVLAKLFTDIGPRYVERPGGYTRILKLGPRPSDAAEMVILELVTDETSGKDKKKKKEKPEKAAKAAAPAKKSVTAEKKVKAEETAEEKPAKAAPVERAQSEAAPATAATEAAQAEEVPAGDASAERSENEEKA